MIDRSQSLPSLGDLELPVDGYVRISRVGDRGGESYISPDVQRRALEGWAAERGVELVLHYPEENVSGATMDRPIFNRIMRRIRAPVRAAGLSSISSIASPARWSAG